MRALLVFLALVALALCDAPTQFTQTVTGQAGNNVIFTQQSGFLVLPNILNPVAVAIEFTNTTTNGETWTANVCLNANQASNPTPGNNFNACPNKGFVSGLTNNVTDAPTGSSKLKFNRQSSSHKLSQFLSKMVEQNVEGANVYTSATNELATAGFTVVINGASALVDFAVSVSYYACATGFFPNADGSDCVAATVLTFPTTTVTVPANSTAYYTFATEVFNETVNNQFVLTSNASAPILVQKGYIPTADWNIAQPEGTTITINTPGYFAAGDTYYFSIQNTGATDLPIELTLNYTTCAALLFGPGCAVNETITNSTDGTTVTSLSATFSAESGGNSNTGEAWQLDLSGSSNQFAYFAIQNYPTDITTPYYVRVSVGNVDLEDDEDNIAPTLYGKKGGYPSAESNDINAGGSVSNQLLLQVDDPETDEWFVAVQIPANFAIWVGVNCAGNCSNGEHGSCVCSYANGTSVDCQDLIVNSTDYSLLYTLPTSTEVSAGSCSCSDTDYDLSFDCSQKSSPTVLFVVLIVIGGLIILFVAIGVPLYCYISNKRKERYERI